jgi:hypothetical protein
MPHSNLNARTIFTAGVVVTMIAVLTGCTATHPPMSDHATAKSSRVVSRAKTAAQAITQANDAIVADQSAIFEILAGRASGGSMSSFETGAALRETNTDIDTIGDSLGADGITGKPNLWSPDLSRSAAKAFSNDAGTYRYGIVESVGCIRYRGQVRDSGTSSSPSDRRDKSEPFLMTLQYQPRPKIWLITKKEMLGAGNQDVCQSH